MTDSKKLRVLLVDDEVGFAEVIRKRLGKRGIEITTAHGGTEAIQTLRRQDFDVAVVDLKMEDMNGIEVLQVFKRMVPDLPVLLLTGHASEDAARDGMRYGAFDYMLKPCALETLLARIRAAARYGEET